MNCIRFAMAYSLAALLTGCAGMAPPVPSPLTDAGNAYKETGLWKRAAAGNPVPDAWWEVFDDRVLNDLQTRLVTGNLALKQLAARVASARASLMAAQAALMPAVGASLGGTRSDNVTIARGPTDTITLGASASWEVDLWGRLGSGEDAAAATLQASEADFAAGRLSAQAALTQLYFALRTAEVQHSLLDSSVAAYERALELTRYRYDAGMALRTDVLQAEGQWRSAQAQRVEVSVQRAQIEHAIAVLLGATPASFTLTATASLPVAPVVPPMLPSTLLERRPDIAAAERRVAAAYAQIGVADAAFFPALTLSASAGYRGSAFRQLTDAPNLFWSIGPALAKSLFDGGLREAAAQQARAGADAAVTSYRQTVLTALQEVEDNLVLADRLREEAQLQQQSQQAAARTLEITLDQYKMGTVGYLNVVAAQNTLLNSQRSLADVRQRELQAVALLLKNSAGRW
ncbi:efflux transporter outer membrane subunit [Herbaspirillum sp. HC18]|nr:efflux transporter outer membrane subunit [Herbaspirillum sp. HC18]